MDVIKLAASPGPTSFGHSRGLRRTVQPVLLALLGLVAGCSSQPAAPLLSDSPVYRNSAERFRFLVPEGWTQTASSALPTGDIQGEIFLVRYRIKSAELGANLQIICMADGPYRDLQQYHSGSSFRVNLWDVVEPRRMVDVNGVEAERMIYKALADKREMTKHVTSFRRNGRVYSMVGLYFTGDDDARQQIERAAASVIWED
jgi:hypothetical protein